MHSRHNPLDSHPHFHVWMENSFDPWLVESAYVKPMDVEVQLLKNIVHKWTRVVQTHVVQGSLYCKRAWERVVEVERELTLGRRR